MKSFYTTIIILIIVTTNLYPQIEFKDKAVSDPKFQGEQFILEIGPETLDSIIVTKMEEYHIPGLASIIIKNDDIVWNRNYGYANVELNRSVEDSTLFWIASISKTIMATAIMQLWEDGLFDLDDNINDYLQPDFQVINPNHPNDIITFKMLMTHSSSIRDNNSILNPLLTCGDSPVPLDSFLINYYTPGGIYYSTANFYSYAPSSNIRNYTNAGACVIAYLVKQLSGMSFDQYCRENIFDPLDMNETSWFLEGLDTTKIATPYDWTGGQYVARCHQGWPIYPIAFLRTNKIELEHFLSAYMNWGTYNGATILDSTTIDLMLTVHQPSNDQGLIWYKTQINPIYLLWGHPGGQQGTGSMMFFYPEEDWGFIVFFNTLPSFAFYFDIADPMSRYAMKIPVELTAFTASTSEDKVYLNWTTATELNNLGFEIERKLDNSDWDRIGFVEGHGTTTEPIEYSYSDDIKNITANSLAYRLKQIDFDGSYEYSDEVLVEVEIPLPSEFTLHQNYPNPFNPVTIISYSLPIKSQVELVIYNTLGESITRLVNEVKEAGSYSVELNAVGLPSGIYFYRLTTGSFTNSKKMLLLK